MPGLILIALLAACGTEDGSRWHVSPDAVDLPELVLLEAGTDVTDGPPEGWSHRVVRSLPRLDSGDLDSLPATAQATTTLFRPVTTADVVPGNSGYRLSRVGFGITMPVGDRDVVVTPDGPESVLNTLGVVEKLVLKTTSSRMARKMLLARTPTFAHFRSPTVMLVDGRHEEVDLHNALLVDPETGDVRLLNWVSTSGSEDSKSKSVVMLPRDMQFDVALDVQVSRRVAMIPVSWSFAMKALPLGKVIPLSDSVARQLSRLGSPDADAERIEHALRAACGSAQQP